MVVEIVLAMFVGVSGGAALLGGAIARSRVRRLVAVAGDASERPGARSPFRSPAAPATGRAAAPAAPRRARGKGRTRHDDELMIGRTFYR